VADVVLLFIIGAFFMLSIAYVKLCDRIIGPDAAPAPSEPASSPAATVGALEV
jgi:hypothetical protein